MNLRTRIEQIIKVFHAMCDALNVNCLGCLFRQLSALQSAMQYTYVILSTQFCAISCSTCYIVYTLSVYCQFLWQLDWLFYYLLHSVLSPLLVGYVFVILLFEYCFLLIAYLIVPVILSVILLYSLLYCYTVCYTVIQSIILLYSLLYYLLYCYTVCHTVFYTICYTVI